MLETLLHGSAGWSQRGGGVGGCLHFGEIGCPPCRSEYNAAGRHHRPRQRHRVTNSLDYDAALRQRGSLTVIWFTEDVIKAAG